MGDLHTCSYHCHRPECIKAQRDYLRDRLTALESALRDCITHMKTTGSPKAVRACEVAEELLGCRQSRRGR